MSSRISLFFTHLSLLPLMLSACDLPESEVCDRAAIDGLAGDSGDAGDGDFVHIDLHSGDVSTTPVTGALTISGGSSSQVRIDQLRVGPTLARGLAPNFQSWSVELSQAQLQQERVGEFSTLEIVATDVCGDQHSAPDLVVRVDAPTGTPASGLSLVVAPNSAGECYIPADGSATARVSLSADLEAAGVRVKLQAAAAGEFLGVEEIGVALTTGMDQAIAPPVQFRATAAGPLAIIASAGGVFEIDDSKLAAVGAPTFMGAVGQVAVDVPLLVRVRTEGRLGRCWAAASSPTLVEVSGEGVADLLVADANFDQPSCGQEAAFDVQFDALAPATARLELWCADSYGQASSVVLEVQG